MTGLPRAQTYSQIAKARSLPVAGQDVAPALTVEVLKSATEPDRRLVWGWVSVVTKGGKLTSDGQQDLIAPEVMEAAWHDYVRSSRAGKLQHDGAPTMELVEGIMLTKAKQQALGVDLGREGVFAGFYVHDDDHWALAKAGKLPGFSIGGFGVRVPVQE